MSDPWPVLMRSQLETYQRGSTMWISCWHKEERLDKQLYVITVLFCFALYIIVHVCIHVCACKCIGDQKQNIWCSGRIIPRRSALPT